MGMGMMEKTRCCFNIFLMCYAAFRFPVWAQQEGSYRIDCGLTGTSSSRNEANLECGPDNDFIQSGVPMQMDDRYTATTPKIYQTLRSFPNYTRNCYSLPATSAKRYIIRASFMYGNYDGLNKVPSFDLYFGADLWDTIELANATHKLWTEIVVQAMSRVLYACLVNTGAGTPFISSLEQLLLDDDLYAPANSSLNVALKTIQRIDVGSTKEVRYPDDKYDRIWTPNYDSYGTPNSDRSTNISNDLIPVFDVPSSVFQTAVYSQTINLILTGTPDGQYYVFFYFADIVKQASSPRTMIVQFNDKREWASTNVSYLQGMILYTNSPLKSNRYMFSIRSANSSDELGAVLNGLEVYKVMQLTTSAATLSKDVDAINSIREYYRVKKNWVGDPCLPQRAPWDGLKCKIDSSGNQTILDLNLSNSQLNGNITDYFSGLTNLETLDLKGNNLCGSIPSSLQERINAGLTLSIDNSLPICPKDNSDVDGSGSNSKKKITIIAVSVLILIVAVGVLALLLIVMMRSKATKHGKPATSRRNSLRQSRTSNFSYDEIVEITNNFEREIGKGGSGHVFYGRLKDDTSIKNQQDREVAVKILGGSLAQGMKEYTAEIQLLMQVHHKYLASLVGFCNEGNKMILVYHYVNRGNLRELLSDGAGSCLSWLQRVRIALSAATGLEYLHSGCRPPIIHRDVKTTNILVNENLEAKIADFGLSKIGQTDNITHITTAAAGTPGYMDPEYYNTNKLTEKSDVYSFGIVLFELVTGRYPIFDVGSQRVHILQWVIPLIVRGDIASMVDRRLHGQFDINSVWKVVDTAMACSVEKAVARPTMTEVVNGLREAMEIETRPASAESSFGKASLPSSSQSHSDPSEFSLPSAR